MAENQDIRVEQSGVPGWMVAAVVILAIVAIAGVGLAWNDSARMQDLQTNMSGQIKTAQQEDGQQIATLQQKQAQTDAANAQLESDLGVVTKRLRVTQSDLKTARDEAAQIRDDAQQKIAEVGSNVDTVKSALDTKASTDDLKTVDGNVTAVKTDLDGTKNDLKMARSELGTLIARNHDEIDTLRRMGERDYVEFTIQGRNKPQKVGGFTVELRSVNPKKNQFNVALTVDDMRTEKNNRTVDEPIIFYQRGSHQADEFVVNSVSKDKITGYISTPKAPVATTTASGF